MTGTDRVCPECGAPAGEAPFCANCGRNLTHEERLPSRGDWERDRLVGRRSEVQADAPAERAPRSRRALRIVLGVGLLAAIAVGAVIALAGSGSDHRTKTFTVPSGAMEPTIAVGSK